MAKQTIVITDLEWSNARVPITYLLHNHGLPCEYRDDTLIPDWTMVESINHTYCPKRNEHTYTIIYKGNYIETPHHIP